MEAIDFRAHRRRNKIERQYNKDLLLIFKSGRFYNTYGDDSIILNYLFGYKIIKENKVGFPINSIVKVLDTLEDKKISYEVIDKNENSYGKKYDNLNNYYDILNIYNVLKSGNYNIFLIKEPKYRIIMSCSIYAIDLVKKYI